MKNIYDIRKEKQLLYVLPSAYTNQYCNEVQGRCAIIVCLYYPDTVNIYMRYINSVPEQIAVHLYSSNQEVLKIARTLATRGNIFYDIKENRGRDISTLLVAAYEKIKDYEYICFLHDKKEHAQYLSSDVAEWIRSMWDSMIVNEHYIHNVLATFEQNKNLGMLVPPEPIGEYQSHWYGDTWYEDYELAKHLAADLHLNTDITRDKEVFTLGTVFWARTDALASLLRKRWTYEDFPEEPLPADGTISHAIERIIGYAAQDRGYDTGTVMTSEDASRLILQSQEYMRTMFGYLQKTEHVYNYHQVANLEKRQDDLIDFFKCNEKVYIYGAGNYGKSMLHFLNDRQLSCKGFLTSKGKRKESNVCGLPVIEIQEINNKDNVGIIIGVSYEFRDEIEQIITSYGFHNYIYGF